jgi:AraC-like DNA-binding protein
MGSLPPQKLPLAKNKIFYTQQLDEAREVMAKVYCAHSLDFSSAGRSLKMEVREVLFPHSAMILASYGEWVKVSVGEPGSLFACQYLLEGSSTYKIGTEQIHCDRDCGAMISPTKSVDIMQSPDSWILGFRIDRRALEEHLENLSMRLLSKPLEFDGRMDLNVGPVGYLNRYIRFLVDELDREESVLLQSPLALADLEQSVMHCLLLGQPHNYSRYLLDPQKAAAPRQVNLVEEYLEAHVEEPIDITSLAKLTGYSLSSIYKAFRKHRGYSPMAYLKKIRLAHLRKRLLEGPLNTTLTQHALDLGFVHLGRLSGYYKRQFGESPSDTLRKSKLNQS